MLTQGHFKEDKGGLRCWFWVKDFLLIQALDISTFKDSED